MTNSILIDINDPRTEKIAGVISNKTAKKILELIAEKELSQSEIASKLKIPQNTADYNIKNLEEAGFIEKSGFLWSVKGKRMHKYKLSNKRIIISPKSLIKGIIPALLLSGVFALFLRFIALNNNSYNYDSAASSAASVAIAEKTAEIAVSQPNINVTASQLITSNAWAWFLLGALTSIFIFLLWNYIRTERRSE